MFFFTTNHNFLKRTITCLSFPTQLATVSTVMTSRWERTFWASSSEQRDSCSNRQERCQFPRIDWKTEGGPSELCIYIDEAKICYAATGTKCGRISWHQYFSLHMEVYHEQMKSAMKLCQCSVIKQSPDSSLKAPVLWNGCITKLSWAIEEYLVYTTTISEEKLTNNLISKASLEASQLFVCSFSIFFSLSFVPLIALRSSPVQLCDFMVSFLVCRSGMPAGKVGLSPLSLIFRNWGLPHS